MNIQLSIFDIPANEAYSAIHEVAKIAGLHWKGSRKTLISFCGVLSFKHWVGAVRKHYCPYGAAGRYGINRDTPGLISYDMRTDKIIICYLDQRGQRREIVETWENFALEVQKLILTGEFKERGD